MTEVQTALLVPIGTFLVALVVVSLVRFVPKGLMNIAVLPAIGIAINYLLTLAGQPGLDPTIAAIVAASAASLQKWVEHFPEMVRALSELKTPPMVDSAKSQLGVSDE